MSHSDTNDDWLRVKEAYEMIKTAEGRRKARGELQRRRAMTSSSVVGDFVKLSECDHVNVDGEHASCRNEEEGDDDDDSQRNKGQGVMEEAERHDNNSTGENGANSVGNRAYAGDGEPQTTDGGSLYQYQCRCGDIILFDVLDPNGRNFLLV